MTGRPDLEARINYGTVVAGEAHVSAAGLALEDRLHEILSRIVSHQSIHPADMTDSTFPAGIRHGLGTGEGLDDDQYKEQEHAAQIWGPWQ